MFVGDSVDLDKGTAVVFHNHIQTEVLRHAQVVLIGKDGMLIRGFETDEMSIKERYFAQELWCDFSGEEGGG